MGYNFLPDPSIRFAVDWFSRFHEQGWHLFSKRSANDNEFFLRVSLSSNTGFQPFGVNARFKMTFNIFLQSRMHSEISIYLTLSQLVF